MHDWEMNVSRNKCLFPPDAALPAVGVSKVCTLPNTFDDPGTHSCGAQTFRDFKLDSTNRPKVLLVKNGEELRRHVMMKSQELLLKNPCFECHDSTRELDVGTEVHARIHLNGEDVHSGAFTNRLSQNLISAHEQNRPGQAKQNRKAKATCMLVQNFCGK